MSGAEKTGRALSLKEVARVLDAEVVCGEEYLGAEISDYAASDLLSDVLAVERDRYLLLTGLTTLQVVRTAEITGALGVVFVRNKLPCQEAVGLARSHSIPLLITPLTMFEAVRKIVEELEFR